MSYKSNSNVFYSCKYHVVWCPKYRRKVLDGNIASRLKELVYEIQVDIIKMEIMLDHVHLLMEVDPQFGIYRAVKVIKVLDNAVQLPKLGLVNHYSQRQSPFCNGF